MAEIESVLVGVLEILVQFGVAYVKSMQHCCQQPMYLSSSREHALHVAHSHKRDWRRGDNTEEPLCFTAHVSLRHLVVKNTVFAGI